MHPSINLLSFIVLLKLVITPAATNDTSALYYPVENVGNLQTYYNSQHRVQIIEDLVAIRGTTEYEHQVNDLISTGISRVTVTLNQLLTHQAPNANVVFSPLSISGALALILLGSNGVTFKEISQLMGLTSGITDFSIRSQIFHEQFARLINQLIATAGFDLEEHINVATAVFVQAGFPIRPLYKTTAEELYHSSIINVDFQRQPGLAQQQVNNWVATNTKGKIKTILNDFPSSETKVIVASALYFNAEWENHFFAGSTRRRPFFVNGRKSQSLHEVDMMSNGGDFPYYKDPELGCEILGLPYKGNKSTMYVIIPFDSNKEKLHELKLTQDNLERLVSRTKTTGVVILFPKMKIESSFDLKRSLEALGVRSLFNPHQANLALLYQHQFSYEAELGVPLTLLQPGTTVNKLSTPSPRNASRVSTASSSDQSIVFDKLRSGFPNINSRSTKTLDTIRQLLNEQSTDNHYQNPGLYADQVIHKVYMDISEMGTEAAAATSVSLSRDGSRVTFRVDVPFLFFIRHEETKTILFWGSVIVPTPNYRPSN